MKSYNQYCSLALALDRVGERWNLLIIRELLLGEKRYSDLLNGLPGIASNLLAKRLKQLETDGIIERKIIPPPTPAELYQLTQLGKELEQPIKSLIRWAARWMIDRNTQQQFRSHWLVLALKTLLEPITAPPVKLMIELPEGSLGINIEHKTLQPATFSSEQADCIIKTSADNILALASEEKSWNELQKNGFTIIGDKQRINEVKKIFTHKEKQGMS
jgi:DNA-binding HxlR family transcriptional regulator